MRTVFYGHTRNVKKGTMTIFMKLRGHHYSMFTNHRLTELNQEFIS